MNASVADRSAAPDARAARDEAVDSPYRPFSARAVASFTIAGGLLAAVGALGTWIRATRTVIEGSPPEQVAAIGGAGQPEAWGLAALGVATAIASWGWYPRRLLPRVPVVVGAAALIALLAWRLRSLDREAAAMAAAVEPDAAFFSYHAGFGWGAWLQLLAVVALALGLIAGGLRELDLRGGRRA